MILGKPYWGIAGMLPCRLPFLRRESHRLEHDAVDSIPTPLLAVVDDDDLECLQSRGE